MDKSAEAIRTEMDETRSSLSEKLGELEDRVSDTVRTASAAVTGTTESVKGAIDSIGTAFDIPRHARRHPWIVIGGSVAIGYLAARLMQGNARAPRGDSGPRCEQPGEASQNADRVERSDFLQNDSEFPDHSAATAPENTTDSESCMKNTAWQQARGTAISAALVAAQQIAMHVVPQVIDHFMSKGKDERSAEDNAESEHRPSP